MENEMNVISISRLFIGTIALTGLFLLFNLLLSIPVKPDYYLFSLLANLLINIVLFSMIRNTYLKNIQLILFISSIYFVIGQFNILIEAYLFDVSDGRTTIRELLRGFLVVGFYSPIAVKLYKDTHTKLGFKTNYRKKISWLWRVVVGNILYLIVYSIAGMLLATLYPKFLEFYTGKIPPIDLIIKTQLFLRGPILILMALFMLKFINLSLFKRAILIGFTFSILGGVAPLIPTNELMPGYVRFGHLFEVGISNFIFGFLLGYLLGRKRIIEK